MVGHFGIHVFMCYELFGQAVCDSQVATERPLVYSASGWIVLGLDSSCEVPTLSIAIRSGAS